MLREWLNRLKQFDPDDWGEITQLQTEFSEEELSGELEAEIAFDTVGGTVEHVTMSDTDSYEPCHLRAIIPGIKRCMSSKTGSL